MSFLEHGLYQNPFGIESGKTTGYPADMKRKASRTRLLLGPGLAAALLVGLIVWDAPLAAFRTERIRAMGETRTTAVVLQKLPTGDGCRIRYKYSDGKAHALYGLAEFDAQSCGLLRPGAVLPVYVADAEPMLSRVDGEREPLFNRVLGTLSRGD